MQENPSKLVTSNL